MAVMPNVPAPVVLSRRQFSTEIYHPMWHLLARLMIPACLALAYFGQQEAPSTTDSTPGLRADARASDAGIQAGAAGDSSLPKNVPVGIASGIANIEAEHQSILKSQPVAEWRLEPVRARYQTLLKTARGDKAAEQAIRVRLGQVTRDEQAARAAQTIEAILAESHRRDADVAIVRKRIAAAQRTHARAYQAVGVIQPSARSADGRKLYVLIGATGKTVAFLDIPPGLDAEPLVSKRVGVRGSPHYSEDLGARLISVRSLESIDARR